MLYLVPSLLEMVSSACSFHLVTISCFLEGQGDSGVELNSASEKLG
jgi:hypothetical protein